MTPLGDLIARRIAATGPITLAEYMAECLLHPALGYYTTRPPFGTAGDFTTAPEISQMFGELLGLCLAQHWLDCGAPAAFTLAELGPGRGTLMADVLRATRTVPGFHAAARLHLVEASPALRAEQARRLAPHSPVWCERAEDLPDAPLYLLANEFFDALPIRQFRRQGAGWAETVIGLSPEGGLGLGLAPPAPLSFLASRLADTRDGDVVELCPAAAPIIAGLSLRIASHGGLALILDYGGWRSLGDTFQALKAHQPVDPLADPGRADLTAHVDFQALAQAATGLQARYTTQGVLLTRLGIAPRTQRLAQSLAGAALDSHLAAAQRLTHPQEMGELFKALALTRPQDPPPPGFA